MIEEIANEYIALIPNVFRSFSELNMDATELSHMQNHVIEFMYMQKKPLNLKDISTGLGIAKQQLTKIIKDLEMDGYLVKESDPGDKRAVLVSLTQKGREIQDKKWLKVYENFSNHLAKLSDEEKLDLKFALHKTNVLLKKIGD